jgi:CRISPR-associated protein Cas2
MSMTIVVTRNVSDRMRGFLASSMLELAAGVYSAPRVSPAVRERVWETIEEWFTYEKDASIIMLWEDPQKPGGQSVRVLGSPPIDLVELDGIVIARRAVSP